MKKSSPEQSAPPSEEHESIDTQAETSSSGQESDQEISSCPALPSHPTPTMFMPYIEGPKMNWTVDDGLYHRLLKCHLKCKTIKIVNWQIFQKKQKYQRVTAWLDDLGMDLYISWSLPKEELTLDTIWVRFEEFSKPQLNEVRAHFDLLTIFSQGNRNVDEWYNAVQAQVNIAKYPLETAKVLHRDIFWFFMKDKDFVTKTINEGNVNIQKFPTSKVQQLAKKMESSKATAKHIQQVTGNLPTTQIHFMHHQCTKLPARNYNKHKKMTKQKPQNHRPEQMAKKPFDLQKLEKPSDKCIRCGDTSHTKGFQCPAKSFSVKCVINSATSHQSVTKKKPTDIRHIYS